MNVESVPFLGHGVNVASVMPGAPVPEPAALLLAGLVLGALLLLSCRYRRRWAKALLGSIVVGLAAAPVHAQSTGPDYSQVSDFLNGQRSLLNVTDLEVVNLATNVSQGIALITTSNSNQTYQGTVSFPAPSDRYTHAPVHFFSARMFNQPAGITITPLYDYNNSALLTLYLRGIASLSSGAATWTPLPARDEPGLNCGAVADFTQDGYDDLALSFADGRLLIVSPNDRNDVSKGFRESIAKLDVLGDMTAGDFRGDGQREIAGLTIVPTDQQGGGGLKLVTYAVDSKTLAITPATSLNLTTPGASPGTPITQVSIARGRFNGEGHDQLAVAFSTTSGPAYVEIIDFTVEAGTLKAREASPAQESPAGNIGFPYGYLQVKTGQFGMPENPYDQIVYHSSSPQDGGRFFEILTVDPSTLAIASTTPVTYNQYPCALGIQVGNFDHRQADPSNPGKTGPNLNAQIAFMWCESPLGVDPSGQAVGMNIYSVDPQTLNVNGHQDSHFDFDENSFTSFGSIAFVPVDTQGRSVTLGEPTKITIDNTSQPSVVVGVPPMHVDFIDPLNGDGKGPRVLNLSFVPDGFKTTYNQQDSTGNASSTTNTTSWSFGAKESATVGFTIGDPDVEGLKGSDTFTAAQNLKGSLEHEQGSYTGQSFNLTTISGVGDQVNYSDSELNIWVYPVIGKTVCPAKLNCPPNEQVPLTIQFSALNGDVQPYAIEGPGLPWYQPPWEPGNIFSYPANYDQLAAHYGNLVQLSGSTNGFPTDGRTVTESVTWFGTSNQSDTTGLKQNYSFENDFSVNGSVGFAGITAQGGYGLDVSGSYGLSGLVKTTTTLDKSTGLEIGKPGTFPNPRNYQYLISPYIVGSTQPAVVDTQQPSGDIQTAGVLRGVFTADPLDSRAGKWWRQAYSQAPDVALNHPSRWQYTPYNLPGPNQDIPSNCLAVGDGKSMDCAALNQRSPDDPALDTFHAMSGFFISSANTSADALGPQLEQAKAGDVLRLSVRVYNYSLASMPNGSKVHVRFYFMPWDDNSSQPLGKSDLIHEETVDPIPPFNDDSSVPNWVLVPTKFDTSQFDQTKSGGVYVAFWVVVWMQDQQGNLISEMPAHGLTAIPGTLTSLADAAKLEEVAPDGNSYSNDVGFFPQDFYIASPGAAPASPIASVNTVGNLSVNTIGNPDISANRVDLGGNVVVSAMLSASGGAASGVNAIFYDGDPSHGGRPVAVKRIPHIADHGRYKVETLYHGKSCGVHELFLVVNRGRPNEVVRQAPPLNVACRTSQ